MRGHCMSFKPYELVNPSTLKFLQKLSDIFEENSLHSGGYHHALILVDTGGWLEQSSWQDHVGWFVKFRISPHYVRKQSAKDAAHAFIKAVCREFCATDSQVLNASAINDESGEEILIIVKTDSFSIGD